MAGTGSMTSLVPGSLSRRIAEMLIDWLWVPSAILALAIVLTFAVDIPYIDQWDGELPFLQRVAAGEASCGDVIALQLEHRIAINRIVALVVSWVAGWHTKACLLVNWLAVCLIVFNLCLLQRQTTAAAASSRWAYGLLAGAVMFSLPQYDSWFNPSMIAWFAVQVLLTTALLLSNVISQTWLRWVVCALVGWVATFSASHGMLLWLALGLFLAARRWKETGCLPFRWLVAWGGMAIMAIGFYFWGYSKPPESPSVLAGLRDPIALAGFFLANIGAPLAFGTPIPPVIQARFCGAVIVGVTLVCAIVVLFRLRQRPSLDRTLPWFALLAYALLTKAAISAGRAGSGPDVALASRYMPTANLIICALAALLPIVLDELVLEGRTDASRFAWLSDHRTKAIKISLFAVLLAAEALGAIATLPTYANERIRLTAAKAAVLFSRCFKDSELLSNVWSHNTLVDIEDKLDFMDSHGLLRPKTFRSCKIADLPKADRETPAVAVFRGAIEQAGHVNEQAVGFMGWAVDPERGKPADAVLLSWEDDAFDATVFAIVPVGVPRPDVTAKLSNSRFLRAGWGRLFPTDVMPKRSCRIRAWAFNTDDGTIAELDGVVEWRPEG